MDEKEKKRKMERKFIFWIPTLGQEVGQGLEMQSQIYEDVWSQQLAEEDRLYVIKHTGPFLSSHILHTFPYPVCSFYLKHFSLPTLPRQQPNIPTALESLTTISQVAPNSFQSTSLSHLLSSKHLPKCIIISCVSPFICLCLWSNSLRDQIKP